MGSDARQKRGQGRRPCVAWPRVGSALWLAALLLLAPHLGLGAGNPVITYVCDGPQVRKAYSLYNGMYSVRLDKTSMTVQHKLAGRPCMVQFSIHGMPKKIQAGKAFSVRLMGTSTGPVFPHGLDLWYVPQVDHIPDGSGSPNRPRGTLRSKWSIMVGRGSQKQSRDFSITVPFDAPNEIFFMACLPFSKPDGEPDIVWRFRRTDAIKMTGDWVLDRTVIEPPGGVYTMDGGTVKLSAVVKPDRLAFTHRKVPRAIIGHDWVRVAGKVHSITHTLTRVDAREPKKVLGDARSQYFVERPPVYIRNGQAFQVHVGASYSAKGQQTAGNGFRLVLDPPTMRQSGRTSIKVGPGEQGARWAVTLQPPALGQCKTFSIRAGLEQYPCAVTWVWRLVPRLANPVRDLGVVGYVHSAIQPATIKSLSGVEVPVVRGQALSIGEVITTGAKGRVKIDMSGNDEWISRTVYVAPNSSLRIESLEDQLALDIRRRQKRYNPGGVFGLLRGAIRYWNDKRMYGGPPGHPDYDPYSYFGFSIRAGVAVCGGRGTDVVVTYEPGRKVAGFYLREGAIQLETAQGTRGVKGSGQVTVTGGRAGPTQPLNAQQWARLERATHIAQPAAHAATPAPVPQPAVPAPAPPVVAPTPPVAPHTPTPTVDPRVLELLRRLTPGWGTARPSLRGLAIGRSTPAEVQAALGPPRFVSRTAQGSFVCEHDGRALGLHTVVVHYGQRGRVAQLELRFASALPRDEVARKFGLGPPAATVPFAGCVVELHPANRVELTVQGGAVTSLRTTGAPPARVTTMPQPTPPPTLPPTPAIPPPTAPPPVPPAPAPAPAPPTLRQVQTVPAQAVGTRGATTPRVTVRRVWYQANMQVAGDPGLVIYADLLASGCKGQQMTATVRLRQHTGQAVMAARGAPAQCVDQRGRFVAQATDQVLHDTAQWQAYQVFVPYRFLGLTSGQVHNLAISFTATCKGHRTGMEALCTFRTR